MVGKTLAAIAIVLAFRYPLASALTIGASLAQIGEFSFILAGLGLALGLLLAEGRDLVLAAALVSIAANAAVFGAIEPLLRWLRGRSALARQLDARADPFGVLPDTVDAAILTGHVVVAGYGRVGRRIGADLRGRGVPFVVAEQNREAVDALRQEGVPAVSGDASTAEVLVQAHVARAALLAIAIPDAVRARRMVEIARALNPAIRVVARTHDDDEAALMRAEGIDDVLMGEEELARGMAAQVVARLAERAPPR